jgi:molybdopterin converting factor small subunit
LQVTFKLFAGLAEFLPPDAVKNAVVLQVPEGTSVSTLIKQHHLPPELVHLVLVNGVYQDSGVRDEVCLQDGDALAIWPPVAGG